MRARLESLDGAADIYFDRPLTLVGRQAGCDVRLDSPRVSRCHCCLAPVGDGAAVRDLGSTNGTRINGRRVASGQLRPGDELTIGHSRYRLTVCTSETTERVPDIAPREPGGHSPESLSPTVPTAQVSPWTTDDRPEG
jgi:pSer/pThr/pTyr-binding forkhead associated (FHA) protein